MTSTKPNLLLCCSGSVACVKVPELVGKLSSKFNVLVVTTENGHYFIEKAQSYNSKAFEEFESIGGICSVIRDSDEWHMWDKMGSKVLHIELRRWADILLVAPASANLIAKASCGISDNLVLSILRAWSFAKPCVLCPAMNTVMWDHPTTAQSLAVLSSWGYEIMGPVEKLLACNEVGNGALVSVQDIYDCVVAKNLNAVVDREVDAILKQVHLSRSNTISASATINTNTTHDTCSHDHNPLVTSHNAAEPSSSTLMVCTWCSLCAGVGFGLACTLFSLYIKARRIDS